MKTNNEASYEAMYIYELLQEKHFLELELSNNPKRYYTDINVVYKFKDLIDNIDVIIYIRTDMYMNDRLYYTIEADNVNTDSEHYMNYIFHTKKIRCEGVSVIKIDELIKDIHRFVENSYFEKRTCVFLPFTHKCNGKGVSGEMCSVCHDKTKSKTECRHALCLECFQSIQKRSSDDGVICPICRADNISLMAV